MPAGPQLVGEGSRGASARGRSSTTGRRPTPSARAPAAGPAHRRPVGSPVRQPGRRPRRSSRRGSPRRHRPSAGEPRRRASPCRRAATGLPPRWSPDPPSPATRHTAGGACGGAPAHDRQGRADPELPDPRGGGEVGVRGDGDGVPHGLDEGRDARAARTAPTALRLGPDRPSAGPRPRRRRSRTSRMRQQRPDDVELLLDGQRPEVLHRRGQQRPRRGSRPRAARRPS